jgi:hypothetical protein
VVGRHGDTATRQHAAGRWTASVYVRDQDGARRRVRATGRTKTAARTALEDKLDARPSHVGDGIGPEVTVARLAEIWLEDHAVAAGLAPQTLDRYRTLVERLVAGWRRPAS